MQRDELIKLDLPDTPGVYLFKKGKKVLYVGKATSLRDRVRSYFDDDLIVTRGPRVVDMVTQADRVAHEPTPTVLEALVREAALIKQYLPKANVEGKDDKTFLYTIITNEEIPRVLTVRGKDIDQKGKIVTTTGTTYTHIFGPFPSGNQLKEALRLIRRIFPFFDTPRPVQADSKHQRARIEFNRQIGQYPSAINIPEYRRTIRNVAMLLSGRGKELRKSLERDMKNAAKDEAFEEAAFIRKQLFALDHIQDVSLIKEEREETSDVRIEAYDTAHLSGTNAIGVMTVLVGGVPNKREYRTFRIRGVGKQKNDDIASLTEILSRRIAHPEWQYPTCIVIDGGKTHKKAAETVLKNANIPIHVVAVVKDDRHRAREIIGALRSGISEADAVLANSEAHRFAISAHRKARRQALIKKLTT